jgi:hypothetical protein
MTREEFLTEAYLRALQGLLSASGEYRDEFIVNPAAHMATAARQYAEELTQQVYGDPVVWPSEIY